MAFYTGNYRDQNMMSGTLGYSKSQVAIHNRAQSLRQRIGDMNASPSTKDRYYNMVGRANGNMFQALRTATGGANEKFQLPSGRCLIVAA